jgi:peroxiredoxin
MLDLVMSSNQTNNSIPDAGASSHVQPPLLPGDPAPWFRARSDINADFNFASLGGRRIILSFVGSLSRGAGGALHNAFIAGSARLAAFTTALLLVTSDSADEGATVPSAATGVRYFFDDARHIAALYGVEDAGKLPISFIVDERLRICAVVSTTDPAAHVDTVFSIFDYLPALQAPKPAELHAPVLIVPGVFEPDLCRALIAGYEENGGQPSGFMVEREGLTVQQFDHNHKRRSDWNIAGSKLVAACHYRIQRRLVPELVRAFQFKASRIERNLVACYRAEERGHFARHRDNTTKGTAHRRFAVSINLNTGDYDGGDLVFPEFGQARFRPPAGGACVFSCSLLHEATAVVRGRRYVYVPFLYDEASAELRQQNLPFLAMNHALRDRPLE